MHTLKTVYKISNFKGLTLDIGSGSNPRGDVNIDLYVNSSPHLIGDVKVDSKAPNFIRADAVHLPFRDNSFELANIAHVLEHTLNPSNVIKEMRRVSSKYVTIEVPNVKFILTEENPTHLYSWGPRTLKNLLKKYFKKVTIVNVPLMLGGGTCFYRLLEGVADRLFGSKSILAICEK